MTLMALLSGAGSLGSLFFRDDPADRFSKTFGRMQQTINPELLNRYATQFYRSGVSSPAFSQARMATLSGAAAGQRGVMSSLAQRGLNTSGIGALSNVGSAAGGLNLSRLYADLWNRSMGQAGDLVNTQLGVAGGMPRGTTSGDMYAGFNDALSRMFMAYSMRGKQQSTMGG
jgi:hypothetical protein